MMITLVQFKDKRQTSDWSDLSRDIPAFFHVLMNRTRWAPQQVAMWTTMPREKEKPGEIAFRDVSWGSVRKGSKNTNLVVE